jgi:ABC-type glutathione transport system ATPase component
MARITARTSDAFVDAVEAALDHFANPVWLGTHSPLAAPYFLGHTLDRYEQSAALVQRGQALQTVLRSVATQLDSEQRELLRVAYFERNQHLDNVGLALALHLSERTFYRSKVKAVAKLADRLNQALLPTLRSAAPLYKVLVGRALIQADCLLALRAGHSLYLSGASGVGKTTLAAAIAKEWQAVSSPSSNAADQQSVSNVHRTFWFTVRPRSSGQFGVWTWLFSA